MCSATQRALDLAQADISKSAFWQRVTYVSQTQAHLPQPQPAIIPMPAVPPTTPKPVNTSQELRTMTSSQLLQLELRGMVDIAELGKIREQIDGLVARERHRRQMMQQLVPPPQGFVTGPLPLPVCLGLG